MENASNKSIDDKWDNYSSAYNELSAQMRTAGIDVTKLENVIKLHQEYIYSYIQI